MWYEKLKELAGKATQSKWEHDGLAIESGRGTIARCPTPQNEGVFDCHQNAEYIAAANPRAILEILNAHQALYEALRALPLDSFGDDMSKHDAAEFVDHAGEFFEAMVKARAALALADAAQEGEANG